MTINLSKTRTWQDFAARIETIQIKGDPIEWLLAQSLTGYVLAHLLDGVNWGWMEQGKLVTSRDIEPQIIEALVKAGKNRRDIPEISPSLHAKTLQQVRFFNKDQEILIWSVRGQWHARSITDEKSDPAMAFDETHLLWGTGTEATHNGFSLLSDGSQGLRHIPPFGSDVALNHRAALQVRHYLTTANNGIQSISVSRLVGFTYIEEESESDDE